LWQFFRAPLQLQNPILLYIHANISGRTWQLSASLMDDGR
jgi:hypothetical protein